MKNPFEEQYERIYRMIEEWFFYNSAFQIPSQEYDTGIIKYWISTCIAWNEI